MSRKGSASSSLRSSLIFNPHTKYLPFFISAIVGEGYGRGCRRMGMPTASLDPLALSYVPTAMPSGVYYGWSSLEHEAYAVYPTIIALGYNPFFENDTLRCGEVNILHDFTHNFYGEEMKTVLLGYIRELRDFDTVDDLRMALYSDRSEALRRLSQPDSQRFGGRHPYWMMDQTSRFWNVFHHKWMD